MRLVAILALLFVLAAGLSVSYLVYRQLDSQTVLLEASPKLAPNGSGATCGTAAFQIDARTTGLWLFPVNKGQVLSGVVNVVGDENADIGLKIFSPSNRLVLYEPERQHHHEFELPPAVRGNYRFEFDNRHSTFTEKDIAVQVCLA